ncbi:MAG TPA: DNA replication/repair protein RecF [Alphaproteobacteria bacterium]|nr:DNA replication/repair protein RecF [Alphaproteobacteria bacterium]
MAVTRLTVSEFRSYAEARLETDARPVVLTGPNGAGKTNLLEAVSFLAPGRGLRRATLAEIRRRAAPPDAAWAVAARLETPQGEVAIGTGTDGQVGDGGARRLIRIDGHPAPSQATLGEYVALVWLTPQMDRLFIEGAGNRRRFLDRLVFGFHPEHAAALTAYDQAMRDRSRLLRDERDSGRRADPAWLSALEETMAGNAVAIAAARVEVVGRLGAAGASGTLADGPFPQAVLDIEGTVEGWLREGPALAAEEALKARLIATRRLDGAIGGASEGPHRSDLLVRHRAKDMPAALCSTGEQKALLIGIVLANARLLAAERGAAPLLLLDEVAAHLDQRRRAALYEEILALKAQAWLTGTDRVLFAELGDRAHFVGIEDARITDFG